MHIIIYRRLYFILPAILVALAIAAIATFGLKAGVDLKGGALVEVSYSDGRPAIEEVEQAAAQLGYGEVRVQPTGENGYILRSRELSVEEHNRLLDAVRLEKDMHTERFTSIGATIGNELRAKGVVAIICVSLTVILYIAFVFRHVSEPVASWKYGFVAVLTLMHDILIPTGLFAILGETRGAEVDALFIVAVLTILGISINDTIVVFDRIRENLRKNKEKGSNETFEQAVGRSMDETTARSINTSLAVVIALLILYIFGPEATRNMSLVLTVGMMAGTYSSIFLASPLLVELEKFQKKEKPKDA